jgi:transposase
MAEMEEAEKAWPPRDKAKVEQAVLIVERWLLGRLRHRTFYSLSDVNAAIADLMTCSSWHLI